jgi:hypothetical protein
MTAKVATPVLKTAFDPAALAAGLESTSLADAPKALGDLLSILFAWLAASLILLTTTNPIMAIVSGFLPSIISTLEAALLPMFPGLSVTTVQMTLTKAFDPAALLAALKSAETPDLEIIANDDIAFLLSWVTSSLAMGNSYEIAAGTIVNQYVIPLITTELAALEKMI